MTSRNSRWLADYNSCKLVLEITLPAVGYSAERKQYPYNLATSCSAIQTTGTWRCSPDKSASVTHRRVIPALTWPTRSAVTQSETGGLGILLNVSRTSSIGSGSRALTTAPTRWAVAMAFHRYGSLSPDYRTETKRSSTAFWKITTTQPRHAAYARVDQRRRASPLPARHYDPIGVSGIRGRLSTRWSDLFQNSPCDQQYLNTKPA